MHIYLVQSNVLLEFSEFSTSRNYPLSVYEPALVLLFVLLLLLYVFCVLPLRVSQAQLGALLPVSFSTPQLHVLLWLFPLPYAFVLLLCVSLIPTF